MVSFPRRIWQLPGWIWLISIGLVSEGIYFFYFARSFPLARYYDKPLLDLGKITAYKYEAGYTFVVIFTALFVLYYTAYRLARRMRSTSFDVVLLFGALFSVTLIWVYPVGAADVFDYISLARILAVYDANPFIKAPADFPGDAFLPYVAWKHAPAPYGPLWAWLSAAVTFVAGNSLFPNLVAFKLLTIAFYLASALMISAILGDLAPHLRLGGTILFAWNPLVVYEVSVNAHNDIVMVFLLLTAVFLLQRDRKKLSITFLTLSYLVKYLTAALLPVFVVTMAKRTGGYRQRLGFLAATALIVIGITGLMYAPFWSGLDTLGISRKEAMFTASLPTLALIITEPWVGSEMAYPVISRVAAVALTTFAIAAASRAGPRTLDAIRLGYQVLFFYLLFLCLWFQPWYLIWLVALAALVGTMDIAHRTVLFCYTAIMSYFVFVFYWIWNAQSLDWSAIQQLAIVVIYPLPIAYTVYALLRVRLTRQVVESHNVQEAD